MILLGDCLERLKELEDNSVDSVVTDPPYGLKFMGKKWDYDVPSVAMWGECLRVLKPGGHVLAFGGTRTYHRLACNIEDAGFEIRDQLQWLYGSGFPKSLDISKAIDKKFGAMREVIGEAKRSGSSSRAFQSEEQTTAGEHFATKPASPEAYRYKGWGTALKPANEPIVLARKPLSEKTVAKNFLKWGVGGLNIDESRIGFENGDTTSSAKSAGLGAGRETANADATAFGNKLGGVIASPHAQGRWPSNVLLDERAAEMLDEQSGDCKTGALKPYKQANRDSYSGSMPETREVNHKASSGGASRFFYCAKTSKRERNAGLEGMPEVESGIKNDSGRGFSESDPHKKILNQNHHPTVKPLKLMEYLIKLVTPPGGVCLDPFMGSGSTGVAAFKAGFKFIGIEMNEEYVAIAEKRMEAAK